MILTNKNKTTTFSKYKNKNNNPTEFVCLLKQRQKLNNIEKPITIQHYRVG